MNAYCPSVKTADRAPNTPIERISNMTLIGLTTILTISTMMMINVINIKKMINHMLKPVALILIGLRGDVINWDICKNKNISNKTKKTIIQMEAQGGPNKKPINPMIASTVSPEYKINPKHKEQILSHSSSHLHLDECDFFFKFNLRSFRRFLLFKRASFRFCRLLFIVRNRN